MCTDKNNDKNKTNLPLPPSALAKVVLIAEKLLRLRLRILPSLTLFLLAFCEKVSVSEYIIFYCKFVGGG